MSQTGKETTKITADELERMGGNYLSTQDLPQTIVATIVRMEYKLDKNGQKALFITLETEDERRVVQKYGSTLVPSLVRFARENGLEGLEVGQQFTWKKAREGRAIYDRFMPIKSGGKK